MSMTEHSEAAETHVYGITDNCRDRDCEHAAAHEAADERWCESHGWALGNPCEAPA